MPVKNEIGNVYHYLTVIERAENTKDGRAQWLCECKCGNKCIVLGKHLRSGNTKSCGCYQKEKAIESNENRGGGDLTGKRFGKLTVLYLQGYTVLDNGKRRRMWHCRCDCGNECDVMHTYLTIGDTNSCGCINSLGNMNISKILKEKNINFKAEYSFKDFICNTNPYRFDFGLLNENNELLGLIEYQGIIHFSARSQGWNTEDELQERIKRDLKKKEYCEKNNIKLFYIMYNEDLKEKLEEILNELYGE